MACIGDSITKGGGVTNQTAASYPARLQELLGDGYEVTNLGVGSCTLIRKGDPNVWATLRHMKERRIHPDLVVVSLGINDTCGGSRKCWDHKDDFAGDYRDLIDELGALPSKPRIWICAPTPMVLETPGLAPNRVADLTERRPRLEHVIRQIKAISEEKQVGFIDLNSPLAGHPECFTDGVHMNAGGYRKLAGLVAGALRKDGAPESKTETPAGPVLCEPSETPGS